MRIIEWLFNVSAFWDVFALISLLFALISFRASSILARGRIVVFYGAEYEFSVLRGSLSSVECWSA